MPELRSVDPRTLTLNPNNPRRATAPPAMDEQLTASIKAIGIIQPPVVRVLDGALAVTAGNRRVKAAIAAGLASIDVLVKESEDNSVPMESLSENLIRASMNSVDIWRAVESLEKQGWNEQATADALALPVRTIKRLKLLAHLHPPILEVMARGDMPSEDQLRTIAAAALEGQAQVWKKHRPKKTEEADWYSIAHALSKRRMPFSAAKFDDALAEAYGVVWEDDLFVPAGQDGRYTTNVDGFFGAQQAWLEANLPDRGSLLPHDEHGQLTLPRKAERVWGKPTKSDRIGCYLDPRSGEVREIAYRLPPEKKAGKGGEPAPVTPVPRTRPPVTQKGSAMIGDFRTDALNEALRQNEISDTKLLALLVLALAAKNVSVQSGSGNSGFDREAIRSTIIEGGLLTDDEALIRAAARSMLTAVLSCRDNMSNSGIAARIAGDAIGASHYLRSMASEEFLSCLSRQALEHAAAASNIRVEVRVKDTRARMVERFAGATWHYPGALFALSADEIRSLESWDQDSAGSADDPMDPGSDLDPDDRGFDPVEDETAVADGPGHLPSAAD